MTSPELELLKDAFIWEQQQMQAWMRPNERTPDLTLSKTR